MRTDYTDELKSIRVIQSVLIRAIRGYLVPGELAVACASRLLLYLLRALDFLAIDEHLKTRDRTFFIAAEANFERLSFDSKQAITFGFDLSLVTVSWLAKQFPSFESNGDDPSRVAYFVGSSGLLKTRLQDHLHGLLDDRARGLTFGLRVAVPKCRDGLGRCHTRHLEVGVWFAANHRNDV